MNRAAEPLPQPAASLPHLAGLDILRGLAILAVLLFHGIGTHQYLFQTSPQMHWLGRILWQSYHGVHLFFILSGFLITRILLDARDKPHFYAVFYRHRALRILPAYLLTIAVLLATHTITWPYAAICLLCLCNMTGLFGLTPEYGPLWSLSVEEQFYLAWPFVVRHLSLRRLTQLCLALILLTPALRFALLYGPSALHDVRFKTWVLTDFFAAGALLAILFRSRQPPRVLKLTTPLLLGAAALLTILPFLPANLHAALSLEPWLLAFAALTAIALSAPVATHSIAPRLLIFLAKISYGLYLCHQFLFDLIERHWPILPTTPHLAFSLALRFLAESTLAIAIATISRYSFEAFFLRMKARPAPSVQAPEVAPYN